jgi:hypothetical protein
VPRGLSLHVGLNVVDVRRYGGLRGELTHAEHDALDLRALEDGLGYDSTLLLTSYATHDAVSRAIGAVGEALGAGDAFLLTYSGCGTRTPVSDERDGGADGRASGRSSTASCRSPSCPRSSPGSTQGSGSWSSPIRPTARAHCRGTARSRRPSRRPPRCFGPLGAGRGRVREVRRTPNAVRGGRREG